MIIPASRDRLAQAVGAAAALVGCVAAIYYFRLGLTLSHYDARGHLVVARRTFDSITPGWGQIGAVWLPLPHLLNAVPVQFDAFYRTGASAVLISVAAFALACAAIAWLVERLTGSPGAAIVAAVVFAANPNVLYLQSTPMTELLLLGLTTCGVALLVDWCDRGEAGRRAGWVLALACLTRYEAWPVVAAALTVAVWVRRPACGSWGEAARGVARIALYPAATILAFACFSRIVIGEWFMANGFFVPENVALGHPMVAIKQIAWGVRMMSGMGLTVVAGIGLVLAAVLAPLDRTRRALIIPATFICSASLPFLAFTEGHPYRIRYAVPLMVAQALGIGLAAGLPRRGRLVAVALVLVVAGFELRPLDAAAPMVVEAQWDRPNIKRRAPMTRYLATEYRGETVMASMGSLGHYIQELSLVGFGIRDFLHEGNGDIWLNALVDPRPYAGWILIDEQGEGGDMLAVISRKNPRFLDGFTRVAEGGGVALYRRGSREIASTDAER